METTKHVQSLSLSLKTWPRAQAAAFFACCVLYMNQALQHHHLLCIQELWPLTYIHYIILSSVTFCHNILYIIYSVICEVNVTFDLCTPTFSYLILGGSDHHHVGGLWISLLLVNHKQTWASVWVELTWMLYTVSGHLPVTILYLKYLYLKWVAKHRV